MLLRTSRIFKIVPGGPYKRLVSDVGMEPSEAPLGDEGEGERQREVLNERPTVEMDAGCLCR